MYNKLHPWVYGNFIQLESHAKLIPLDEAH